MINLMVLGSVIASLLAAPVSASTTAKSALSAPPSDRIVIDVVTVNGSGCPAGTATVATASDNTAFTVTYSAYLAQVGGGADPTDFRKNCQLNLRVQVPQGFTFAIAQADYRGFASLADGANGLEQAGYYFQGSSETAYVGHAFHGPFSGDWQTTDRAALVFGPCGLQRNLNVNTELRVDSGTANPTTTSFMTMDTTKGSVRTLYHLAWKQC
jgi:hypothetical protein